MNVRIGTGYDAHRLVKGLPLWLGGVNIPHEKGCLAHSDGDVLIHALIDALLGALALGDIGQHFPDTDLKYKNISSIVLLQETWKLIKQKQFTIINADATIILQEPKISPFVASMRRIIASTLETGIDNISVKATTTEGLGFTGKKEGIAATVVVLLRGV